MAEPLQPSPSSSPNRFPIPRRGPADVYPQSAMPLSFSTADLALARRCEAAEAANGRSFGAGSSLVETLEIGGGTAVFAGPGSPMTHALGIGVNGPMTAHDFDVLERFFHSRGSDCLIDLCPLADPTVLEQITKRNYRIVEFNNLMLKRLSPEDLADPLPTELAIEEVEPNAYADWCRLILRGFTGLDHPPDEMLSMFEGQSFGQLFRATWLGQPAGGASMSIQNGVATLHGDSTLISYRNRGIQRALIQHRLMLAESQGADLAMACVIPGSASHRNYEKCGFHLFYMRVNVARSFS
ncbi:MAG: GNAT family N-acetyltransferase [Bryobacteraceae bacterium]|nr:GNAT family N-acetyltransferase [Bryobacteraceae bacterium]